MFSQEFIIVLQLKLIKGFIMDAELKQWREEGKHLPEFLRDFHDQKDFFKTLHDRVTIEDHGIAKDINFTQGHAYTVDCLLHFLARFGYTIQKSRAKQNFDDLNEVIKQNMDWRRDMFAQALSGSDKPVNPNQSEESPKD